MKILVFKGLAIFFILLVATGLMVDIQEATFGSLNFFEVHGVFFLIFITFFPRLTLLFSSVPFGGILWWLGFFFCPRVLVATLATVAYFHTNPVLVTIAWLVALGGETMEKAGLGSKKNKFVFRTFRAGQNIDPFTDEPRPHTAIPKEDAIEAEFTKKS